MVAAENVTDAPKNWWIRNGGVVISTFGGGLLGFSVGGLIWGVTLDRRVSVIELRGSPQFEAVSNRLIVVEQRQDSVIKQLQTNTSKLDAISDELRKHELDTRK